MQKAALEKDPVAAGPVTQTCYSPRLGCPEGWQRAAELPHTRAQHHHHNAKLPGSAGMSERRRLAGR